MSRASSIRPSSAARWIAARRLSRSASRRSSHSFGRAPSSSGSACSRQRRVVVLVSASDRLGVRALGQTLEAVLADRLQHLEARLAVERSNLPQEALVDERSQRVEHVDAQLAVRIADGDGAVDRAAADEDGEPAEERAFRRVEQVMAPGDRPAKRALSLGNVAGSARQERAGSSRAGRGWPRARRA